MLLFLIAADYISYTIYHISRTNSRAFLREMQVLQKRLTERLHPDILKLNKERETMFELLFGGIFLIVFGMIISQMVRGVAEEPQQSCCRSSGSGRVWQESGKRYITIPTQMETG